MNYRQLKQAASEPSYAATGTLNDPARFMMDTGADIDYEVDTKQSLSQMATATIHRPPYWRDVTDFTFGNTNKEYEKAFLDAQSKINPLILAEKSNPFFKSKYATLGNVLATVRPILNGVGISLKQYPGRISGHEDSSRRWYSLPIVTKLVHVDTGQWEAIVCDIPLEHTPAAFGAAMTWGKRLGLQSLLGLGTVDDDGASQILSRIDDSKAEEVAKSSVEEIGRIASLEGLSKWVKTHEDGLSLMPEKVLSLIRDAYSARKDELSNTVTNENEEKPKRKKDA